jgi:hypothetical protein
MDDCPPLNPDLIDIKSVWYWMKHFAQRYLGIFNNIWNMNVLRGYINITRSIYY